MWGFMGGGNLGRGFEGGGGVGIGWGWVGLVVGGVDGKGWGGRFTFGSFGKLSGAFITTNVAPNSNIYLFLQHCMYRAWLKSLLWRKLRLIQERKRCRLSLRIGRYIYGLQGT